MTLLLATLFFNFAELTFKALQRTALGDTGDGPVLPKGV
jgi:hypothetical protein